MIAGHGSTMAYNKGVLEMQADRLRSKGFDNVYVGFNEFSIPSIRETAEEMVEDGYDEIVILPFFVASGLHVTRDIPVKHFGMPRNATEGTVDIEGKPIKITIDQPFVEERGYGKVYIGYNEFNDPKIEDVIPVMIDEGAEEIIALPLFISLGKHLTMDVPGKLGIENFSDCGTIHRDGRDVELKYAVPVGADPRLCDVLVEKLRKYE